jgi:hypothetical protein
MQGLEVSCAVRPIYGLLDAKGLNLVSLGIKKRAEQVGTAIFFSVINTPDSFQMNSKLVWDCHESLEELVEHNRIQMVWEPE